MNGNHLEFHNSFITEILRFIQKQSLTSEQPAVRLSVISEGLGISEADLRFICNMLRRKHYINLKVMLNNDTEYWLTSAGEAHLAAIDSKDFD